TNDSGEDKWVKEDLHRTSIGTQTNPEKLVAKKYNRPVALNMFVTLVEWQTFLFDITNGAWKGIDNLRLFPHTAGGNSYSWPVGSVNMDETQVWERDTLAHELSHQVMWKEADVSTWGVAKDVLLGDLNLYHRVNYLISGIHAMIEGWAEFIEAIFIG